MKTHPILSPFFDMMMIATLHPFLMFLEGKSPLFVIQLIWLSYLLIYLSFTLFIPKRLTLLES